MPITNARALSLLFFALALLLPASGQKEKNPFAGNWAMMMPNGTPGWLTFYEEEGILAGQLWTVGEPKPILELEQKDDTLHFVRMIRVGAPAFAGGKPTGPRVACRHTAQVKGEQIELAQTRILTNQTETVVRFTGKRMPPLPPRPDLDKLQFGEAISLFNGRNLDGWRLGNPKQINGWKAVDGVLKNTTPKKSFEPFSQYGNLRTDREFMDFNLTLDFMVPPGGNSGIFLRGVYEAQGLDRDSKMQGIHGVGAISNRIEPSQNAGRPGNEWQQYDITLVDRHATVILNGIKVIDNQPIAGATNGGLLSDETIPGPLYLQGDHTAVSYRNIMLRPVLRDE